MMKIDLSSGCLVTVEQAELDRRINGIRAIMKEKHSALCIVMCPMKNGWGPYLTGISGPGRPSEGAILIGESGDVVIADGGNLVVRGEAGAKNYSMAASNEGDGFSGYRRNDGVLADDMDELLGTSQVITVINRFFARADFEEFLSNNFGNITILDITIEAEQFRAEKSEAELEIIRSGCRMMDKLFAGAGIYINPMKYERDIVTDMRYAAYRLGASGVDHQISTPIELISKTEGKPEAESELRYPGRLVSLGDRVDMKFYSIGNDGYYAGMSRSYILGEISEKTSALWNVAVEAQDFAVSLLRPGTNVGEVAQKVNEYLVQQGMLPDGSSMIHGIGYAREEAPTIFTESQIPICENMVLYVGPTVSSPDGDRISCGDLYLVKEDETIRLNELPRKLIRLY